MSRMLLSGEYGLACHVISSSLLFANLEVVVNKSMARLCGLALGARDLRHSLGASLSMFNLTLH